MIGSTDISLYYLPYLEDTMIQPTTILEEALESWQDVRAGFIDEVRNIPGENWDFRPTPEVRSVREVVIHVLEIAMMMTGELTREDTNFRRTPWPKLLRTYAGRAYKAKTRAELLRLLKSQIQEGEKKFRAAGELHMLQHIERFDGNKGTRMAWFWHGIDQESYHRGQITVYARLLGIVPALTQKIQAMSS
jgi:uncharacterized damage-inducible protein DinB